MSGYSDGEAKILTRVQALSNFNSNNTSRGDWLILNRGKSDHYAILRPGSFEPVFVSFGTLEYRWQTVIEVWQRYKDDAQTRTDLYARVAEILTGIHQYPHLGDTTKNITDSQVIASPEPEEMWRNNADGPSWLKWELTLQWHEQIDITYQE